MIPGTQHIIREYKKIDNVPKSSLMPDFLSRYSLPAPVDHHKAEWKNIALIVA